MLADTVKCFWTHEGKYSAGTIQEITPDGAVELIFNFGDPYLLLSTTPPTTLPVAVVVGFQNKAFSICVDGTVKVVAARMFAWGVLALLQGDARGTNNAVTPLGAQWETLVRRLERLVLQGQYERAWQTLQRFLIQRPLLRSADLKLVQAAAKLLDETQGQFRIEDLADSCHTSVRQLQRRFNQVIGTTPKQFARTIRFELAQRRLMFDPDTELTALAYECGYFDQAHFIKDFKAFAGKTPSDYAGSMRRMQDVFRARDVVFLQSASRPSRS
jgi:AraC-like DNA-binding protein